MVSSLLRDPRGALRALLPAGAFAGLLGAGLLASPALLAQDTSSAVPLPPSYSTSADDKCQITLHADQSKGTIQPEVYSQFSEHLGRCIYEGFWVGENSPIPNTRGIRNDVVAALKKIKVPVLRWPGGCFADEYHWRDGIGPRDKRPKMVNTSWGGVVEDNSFGTHEFLDLCEQIGCDAYVSANVGSGTPQEMMDWVEYMTSDAAESPMANLRRKNGRDKAWKLKYFGVGNESWGCGGNMRPEFYADNFRRYNTFVKNYGAKRPYTIASGSSGSDLNWTEVMMNMVGRRMNGLSLHYYTLPSGTFNGKPKGAATGFDEKAWHSTLWQSLKMEGVVTRHSEIMDKTDPQKKIGLIVDEWGTWYDVEPGTNPGFLYQQNTVRDALVAGITLDIFHQHAERVTMANIAQVVNVLQAMILTDKEKMVLTPTYHVFDMYQVHQGAASLPVEVASPDYKMGDRTVPSLHASASRDKAGKIHLSLVNLQPQKALEVSAKLTGAAGVKSVTGRVLTGPEMDSRNTFDHPDQVKTEAFDGAKLEGDTLAINLPAKSVVVLEIQ